MGAPLELDDDWLDRIKQSLNGMEYGSVQIIIHDGRIVQIEKTERKRFEAGTGAVDPSASARDKKDHPPKTSD